MIKKLVKHGNSHALILDKAILELLKIEPDTPLDLSTDGDILTIKPVRNGERRAEIQEALDWVNATYPNALRRLAE